MWRVLTYRKICRVDVISVEAKVYGLKRLDALNFESEIEAREMFKMLASSPQILAIELQHAGEVVMRKDELLDSIVEYPQY